MGRFMVDTKASERQIFNWLSLQSPTQALLLLVKYIFLRGGGGVNLSQQV